MTDGKTYVVKSHGALHALFDEVGVVFTAMSSLNIRLRKLTVLVGIVAWMLLLKAEIASASQQTDYGNLSKTNIALQTSSTSAFGEDTIGVLLAKLELASKEKDTNAVSQIVGELKKYDQRQVLERLRARFKERGGTMTTGNQNDWNSICNKRIPESVIISGKFGRHNLLGGIREAAALMKVTEPLNLTNMVVNSSIKSISIVGCEIQNLKALSSLENLESLTLQDCIVSSVYNIPHLKNLTRVELRNVAIKGTKDASEGAIDLSFLAESKNLRFFLAEKTAIDSFQPMKYASEMIFLSLIDPIVGRMVDLSPLACMKKLQHLALPSITVKNFEVVKTLTQIKDLDIRDIEGVDSLVGFEAFDGLDRLVVTRGQFPAEETEPLKIILQRKARNRRSGSGFLTEVPAKQNEENKDTMRSDGKCVRSFPKDFFVKDELPTGCVHNVERSDIFGRYDHGTLKMGMDAAGNQLKKIFVARGYSFLGEKKSKIGDRIFLEFATGVPREEVWCIVWMNKGCEAEFCWRISQDWRGDEHGRFVQMEEKWRFSRSFLEYGWIPGAGSVPGKFGGRTHDKYPVERVCAAIIPKMPEDVICRIGTNDYRHGLVILLPGEYDGAYIKKPHERQGREEVLQKFQFSTSVYVYQLPEIEDWLRIYEEYKMRRAANVHNPRIANQVRKGGSRKFVTEMVSQTKLQPPDFQIQGDLEATHRALEEMCRIREADAALSEFEFSAESDMEVFRLLVTKATEEVLTEQLEKYCSAFGDRASDRRMSRRSSGQPPYIPTNRTEIVGLLLKHGAHSDEAISNMAHPAKEDLEIFRMMLPAASQKVKTELLQKNVKSFGDHGSWDRKVGHAADRIEVVRLLLESGADPNARDFFGKTPLGNAIEYDGDIRLVKLLFDKGAVAGSLYPKMEIFRNFYQGHGDNVWGTNRYELVELLLTHGFDVNSRGQFGKTPLGELVFFGGWGEPYDMKMAKLLLEHGADPNMKQGENMGSAIDIAFGKFDAKELTELLSKYGGVVSEEAKQKQKERKDRRRSQVVEGRSSRRHGSANGRGERIHEEMERFHNELRKCTDPKERSKLFEEHSRRMREINEFPNHEGVRMQDHKEEAK